MGFVIPIIFIAFVYKEWININGTLSSGDWPYLFLENIREFSFFPPVGSLWLEFYYQVTAKLFVEYFGLSWEIAERILWFWPFLLLSIVSSFLLFKNWISVLLYVSNTYILMVVSGGQMGVAMAYAFSPLMLHLFIKLISQDFEARILYRFIATSIVFGLGLMFDPRLAYIVLIAVFTYFIFHHLVIAKTNSFAKITKQISLVVLPILLGAGLNLFWIKDIFKGNISLIVGQYSSFAGLKFFSFADFSHAFSLLHPNWPENIFGKIYFLKSEFLLLPIVVYSSLLFILNIKNKISKINILFFVFLSLVGVFLSKGTNEPFGFLNQWMFEYIPGMSMFRDSSKFYLLIVMGYSFLIPFSLRNISKRLPFRKLIPLIFVLFWCILIRQAIFGELGGTFKSRSIPDEYIELKRYLISQPQYSGSLWIPSRQRFGFFSNLYHGISASDILGSSDPLYIAKVISSDEDKVFYNKIKEMRVEQIIVPSDSDKELFILDRKYSDSLRNKVVTELDKTEWLIKIPKFGAIVVYEVQ